MFMTSKKELKGLQHLPKDLALNLAIVLSFGAGFATLLLGSNFLYLPPVAMLLLGALYVQNKRRGFNPHSLRFMLEKRGRGHDNNRHFTSYEVLLLFLLLLLNFFVAYVTWSLQ